MARQLWRISDLIRSGSEDNVHALKSPLTVIKISAQRIRRRTPETDERTLAALAAIDASVDMAFLLLQEMQSLEEETAALLVAPREETNMTSVVREVMQQFAEEISRREIRILSTLEEGVIVMAAGGMVEATMRNLLGNAVGASPTGGKLLVTLGKELGSAVLAVEDEGSGISPDCMNQVLERDFTTGKGLPKETWSRRRRYFFAKRNVDLLGGEICIGNKPQGGVSVVVQLPV